MWEHAASIWGTFGEIRKIDEKDKWAVSCVTAALRTEAGYIFWYFHLDTHHRTEILGSRTEHRALLPHYLILQTRHANRNSGGNYWCPLITLFTKLCAQKFLCSPSQWISLSENQRWILTLWQQGKRDPLDTEAHKRPFLLRVFTTVSTQDRVLTLRQSIRDPQNRIISRILLSPNHNIDLK